MKRYFKTVIPLCFSLVLASAGLIIYLIKPPINDACGGNVIAGSNSKIGGQFSLTNVNNEKINSTNIISIMDYEGVTEFLLQEGSDLRDKSFSLIKIKNIEQDIIALGSAQQIYSSIRKKHQRKKILND